MPVDKIQFSYNINQNARCIDTKWPSINVQTDSTDLSHLRAAAKPTGEDGSSDICLLTSWYVGLRDSVEQLNVFDCLMMEKVANYGNHSCC